MTCSSTKIRLIVLVVNINNYTIQLRVPIYAYQFNDFNTQKRKNVFLLQLSSNFRSGSSCIFLV